MIAHQPVPKPIVPPLIGLVGHARTGKDTIARMLEDKYGYKQVAFADPLRLLINTKVEAEPLTREWRDEHDRSKKRWMEYRRRMQQMGADLRTIHPDALIALATMRIDQLIQEGGNLFVVSDVRTPREAEWIRAEGGVIWSVRRYQFGSANGHWLEGAISRVQAESAQISILNDGNLRDLRAAVDAAVHEEWHCNCSVCACM